MSGIKFAVVTQIFFSLGVLASSETGASTGPGCGYNVRERSLIVEGSAEMDIAGQIHSHTFLSYRNMLVTKAEMIAKKNLISALNMQVDLRETSKLSMSDGAVQNIQETFGVISVARCLRGCSIVNAIEEYKNNIYRVTIHAKWSKVFDELVAGSFRSEDMTNANHSAQINEWAKWASVRDFSRTIGSRKFIDSVGTVRYVGIGCVDVESVEINSKRMRYAQDMALQMGRKNLALSLYSEMSSIEVFFKNFTEKENEYQNDSINKDVYYEDIVRDSSRFSFAPEVYATFAVHPITKRKMFVSVCGYEPWQLAQMGFGDAILKESRQLGHSDGKAQPSSDETRIKVFNPHAGKFE